MNEMNKYLTERYKEVEAFSFYRDLFPKGELEKRGEYIDGMYCGIAIQVVDSKDGKKGKRYSVTDDLDVIRDLVATDDFCIMSPVSYAGKSQRQENARFLYAITFDVDGLIIRENGDPFGLRALLHQMTPESQTREGIPFLPTPTYIVSSGTGLHLYYMLKQPIPLFKNVIKQLGSFRHALTKKIWNGYVTHLEDNPQYESVTQGFRMVGSITKDGGRVRAFRVGDKVDMEYMNSFIYDENAQVKQYSYKSNLSKEKAKELYPEWYQRRIVNGQAKGTWTVKRDLYDWWKRRMKEVEVGHRYFCVMALAIYARKCGIGWDELCKDAFEMVSWLDERSPKDGSNPFTEDDIMAALNAYNASYQTFPRAKIEELTAISIPANKRNHRSQEKHLAGARAIRDINNENWREGNGRKPKADLIRRYAAEHPGMSNRQIATALGVSRNTVNKWLKSGWQEEWERSKQPRIIGSRLSVLSAPPDMDIKVIKNGAGKGFDSIRISKK